MKFPDPTGRSLPALLRAATEPNVTPKSRGAMLGTSDWYGVSDGLATDASRFVSPQATHGMRPNSVIYWECSSF